jgi:hypothetical protein
LGFLLEAVQNIDAFGPRGEIDHPEHSARTDADFPHTVANAGHRLPIGRFKPKLHLLTTQVARAKTPNG